jgi:LDH2 family malate/lactate/ureidoglycolate dehydrogenase
MANGIEVDDGVWEQLHKLAKATLVESFDASHLGAGPAD